MGCSNVSTGEFIGSSGCCSGGSRKLVNTPGKIVLFSYESPLDMIFSPPFRITPGWEVLIDAYNLPIDSPIYVNRVLTSSFSAEAGSSCDPCAMRNAVSDESVITFRERMTLGMSRDCWQLVKKSNESESKLQLFIAVPGTYQLELSDVAMLGDLHVELATWESRLTTDYPAVYHAGVCGV